MKRLRICFKWMQNDYIVFFLYRVFADLMYYFLIAPECAYVGLKDEHTIVSLCLSWLFYIFFLLPIHKIATCERTKFSTVVVYAIAIIAIVPFCVLIGSGIYNTRFIVYGGIFYSMLLYGQIFLEKRKLTTLKFINRNSIIGVGLAVILGVLSIATVLYISYKYTGIRISFDLLGAYELREEASGYEWPVIISYFFAWTKAINIILLVYALNEKKYVLALVCFVVQLISFGIDGHKTTLFMAFLAVAVFYFCKDFKVKYRLMTVWGVIGILGAGLVEYFALSTNYIGLIIGRRVFFVPAYLNSCYYDFFSKNPPDYFRRSFLRYFGVSSPYVNLEYIIGDIYYHKPNMRCNNGLIADAITNMGSAGAFLMPILLIVVLHLIDMCASKVNERIYIVSAFYIAITLVNTFLFTTLLTHGLIVIGIILLMIGDSHKSREVI